MKELKLEQLQSKFVGSIVKKSSKYYVTYPNSTREYGYKCNLKQLAEKLNIEVEEFLGDDTVYQTKNKSSFNRYITTLNNAEKERDILSQESFLYHKRGKDQIVLTKLKEKYLSSLLKLTAEKKL